MINYLNFTWLEPWYPLQSNEEYFDEELCREISEVHPLYKIKTKAIARREDCDDVLFELENYVNKYAVVHLTWSRKMENSDFPSTTFYKNFKEWIETCMLEDNREYACDLE